MVALLSSLQHSIDSIKNNTQGFIQRGGGTWVPLPKVQFPPPPKNLRKFYYYREISNNDIYKLCELFMTYPFCIHLKNAKC